MRLIACSRERDVWRSVSTGDWTPAVREHVANCRACREVALVSRALIGLPDSVSLPDPQRIWWRTRWLESRVAAERAAKPIAVWQRVAVFVAVLCLAPLAFLDWPQVWYWSPFDLAIPVIAIVALGGLGLLFAWRAASAED
jgi:predicted anti-sigma-YlaC factor YlaD